MEKDFAFLDEMLPGIRRDAEYATWGNFTGRPVGGYMVDCIVGTKELGTALRKAQRTAERLGYSLLLWDDYHPQYTVDCFLNWASLPENNLTKERYYPDTKRKEMVAKGCVASQSGHSRGSTIGLTIFRLDAGMPVPMGEDFDFMDVRSHHVANGLSEEETNNRESLRAIMERGRFETYRYEWRHYVLVDEPYPDTYFDFCIA